MKDIKEMLNKNKYIYLCLGIIFLLSVVPYLNGDVIAGDDVPYHLNRIIEIAKGLQFKEIPVLIHTNLLDEFGYGSPLFYPDLFLYIPAVMVNLQLGIMGSYKIFILMISFITTIVTYLCANKIFKDSKKSLLTTFLYVLSTYRLGDIYVRGALGEILVFIFIPLIVVGLHEIIFGENKKWWIVCIGIWGVLNSHIISSALVLFYIFLFCLFNIKTIFKDKKRLINLSIAGVISILLSLNFVTSYMSQINANTYVMEITNANKEFLVTCVSGFKDLFNNDIKGTGVNFSIGPVLICLTLLFLFIKDKDKGKESFFIQSFWIGIIMLLATTKIFPWDKLTFLSILQFPYRISLIFTVLFSFVASEAVFRVLKNEKIIVGLILILFLISVIQILEINININDFTLTQVLENFPIGYEEYKPVQLDRSKKFVAYVDDLNKIKDGKYEHLKMGFIKRGTNMEFVIEDPNRPIRINVPLTYYNGYEAYIVDENGTEHELNVSYNDKNANLLITSDKIITGRVFIEFNMPILHLIGFWISNITFAGLIIYIIVATIEPIRKKVKQ